MNGFLLVAAGMILLSVAIGLVRVLRGPAAVDRMMAAQLFGTGGIAGLLLFAEVAAIRAVVDVALVLAVVSAFVGIAFARAGKGAERRRP
jgi:multicomponent Na+:H+ antiporter subunit F